MALDHFRIDDRLIHGQVVVGWGQPCGIRFFVLVDDEVARSDWEQELYRMGVPPEMDVYFASAEEAARRLPEYKADRRVGVLLTGDIETMERLVALARRVLVEGEAVLAVELVPAVEAVALGRLESARDFALGVGELPGVMGWIGNILVVIGTVGVVYPSVDSGGGGH